ncbi:tRNA(m(1)G37)methyltransferase [Perkinsus chesapeaki]|uniref:tRNA (guanine(37)-N1)-methyltransferase n=1 Tax=Perkinsus chesapeaki TaxID=330153 RepID=A0A7J6MQK9_PERCH|nr:tRNA(m(1)G37)methyltransferase [Perkinsus chesapeaki]
MAEQPPVEHAKLNRDEFTTEITVLGIRVPIKEVQRWTKDPKIGKYLLRLPQIRPVQADPTEPKVYKIICFKPGTKKEDLPDRVKQHGVVEHVIERRYEHMSTEEVLRKLLPAELEVPSSFETAGHIAHFNLKDSHMPYKKVIGQVVLDKNPAIKLVVTKVANLSNEFRTMNLDVMACAEGCDPTNFITTVKENGMQFKLDYSNVYWNSRLSTMRQGLLNDLTPATSVVVDMCCGIGAFVIMAAKRIGCRVYANDLNPESTKWCAENMKLNKVPSELMTVSTEDGRDFVKRLAREGVFDDKMDFHFYMNLPSIAITFLDVFVGLLKGHEGAAEKARFLVHCHCFAREDPPNDELYTAADRAMENKEGIKVDRRLVSINEVRDVAPNKRMYCFEFAVPKEILLATRPDEEPPAKRQK